jgi:hypothetical protein
MVMACVGTGQRCDRYRSSCDGRIRGYPPALSPPNRLPVGRTTSKGTTCPWSHKIRRRLKPGASAQGRRLHLPSSPRPNFSGAAFRTLSRRFSGRAPPPSGKRLTRVPRLRKENRPSVPGLPEGACNPIAQSARRGKRGSASGPGPRAGTGWRWPGDRSGPGQTPNVPAYVEPWFSVQAVVQNTLVFRATARSALHGRAPCPTGSGL